MDRELWIRGQEMRLLLFLSGFCKNNKAKCWITKCGIYIFYETQGENCASFYRMQHLSTVKNSCSVSEYWLKYCSKYFFPLPMDHFHLFPPYLHYFQSILPTRGQPFSSYFFPHRFLLLLFLFLGPLSRQIYLQVCIILHVYIFINMWSINI